jgi:hypothetical protein
MEEMRRMQEQAAEMKRQEELRAKEHEQRNAAQATAQYEQFEQHQI